MCLGKGIHASVNTVKDNLLLLGPGTGRDKFIFAALVTQFS